MSGAMVRAENVSLVHTRGISPRPLCSTGTGRASAKTAAHIAVQLGVVGAPLWPQFLQPSAGNPCIMPAMLASAAAGAVIGMA